MNVVNEVGTIIEWVNGYPVKQHFNARTGRWYVYLPVHSGLREAFNKRGIHMLRSHYVFCRVTGWPRVSKSFVIHHSDRDRQNDLFDNLEMMSVSEHNELHEKDEPPAPFRGRKHSPESIKKMQEQARTRGNHDIWGGAKKKHFEATKGLMAEKAAGRKNAMYRHDLDDEAIRRAYELTKDKAQVARIFGCSIQAVRNRLGDKDAVIDWKSIADADLLQMLDAEGNVHALSLKINAPITSLWRKVKKIRSQDAGA